jgi:SMODS and SLOG-associating 2TM effector domain family 5
MPDISPINRIYLTYKARIIAEAKLRLIARLSNFLIIWYSFLLIIASVAVLSKLVQIQYFELLSAFASIGIFAPSIFLATGTLERKADSFRSCYLNFQNIYNSNASIDKKMKLYGSALLEYPNHSSRDDADMIFFTWMRGGKLYDTRGEIKIGFPIIASVISRKLAFLGVVGILFFGPIWYAPNLVIVVASGS